MNGTLFTIFTLMYMLFGVLFYELRVFTYIDETLTLIIALYAGYKILTRQIPFNKPFVIWLAISFFYLIYSLVIESNEQIAIVNDFIMQSKPYLVFFGLMCIKPRLERLHFDLLQGICWISLFLLIAIYFQQIISELCIIKIRICSCIKVWFICYTNISYSFIFFNNRNNSS